MIEFAPHPHEVTPVPLLDPEGETPQAWTINDDSTADWALRKIAEAEAEYTRLADLADTRIAELKAQKESFAANRDHSVEPLKAALEAYFQTVKPSTNTKTQTTYKLLSGSLVRKKAGTKMVADDKKLTEWLTQNHMEGYMKISPKWGDFKKLLTSSGEVVVLADTGEVVDGVTVEETPERFEVKLK